MISSKILCLLLFQISRLKCLNYCRDNMSSPATIKKAKKLVDLDLYLKLNKTYSKLGHPQTLKNLILLLLTLVSVLDSKIIINFIMEMAKKLIVLIWRQLGFSNKKILI